MLCYAFFSRFRTRYLLASLSAEVSLAFTLRSHRSCRREEPGVVGLTKTTPFSICLGSWGDAGRERLSLRTTQRRNESAKRFVYAVIEQSDTAKAKGYDRRRSDLLREPDNSSDGQWASIVTYPFFRADSWLHAANAG